ncbi:MAG: glycosyltransferase, partial [Candidatus Hydrogenedentes bacterium]|nr:glycosyltransferase [Candidatus Hydrogenedentota bacterium]
MRISAVLIVRNEEVFLPGCLESLHPLVDEMVVVDTGSEDQTVQLARQYTQDVHVFEWQDDFALARNFSLAKARGDYVLVADADHR